SHCCVVVRLQPPSPSLFPYTTLFRSRHIGESPILVLQGREAQFGEARNAGLAQREEPGRLAAFFFKPLELLQMRVGFFHSWVVEDRKSTRLNSSHVSISYAVFCLKKK